MEYEVIWLEQKTTKTGKVMANLTLKDPSGVQIENVTVWGDFPGFIDIRPGGKVRGIIQNKTDTNNRIWKTLKFDVPHKISIPRTPIQNPAAELQKEISKSVEQHQTRKEDGFRTSATFRDATLLTVEWRRERVAKGLNTTSEEWQVEWKNVRNWLDSKYDEPFN